MEVTTNRQPWPMHRYKWADPTQLQYTRRANESFLGDMEKARNETSHTCKMPVPGVWLRFKKITTSKRQQLYIVRLGFKVTFPIRRLISLIHTFIWNRGLLLQIEFHTLLYNFKTFWFSWTVWTATLHRSTWAFVVIHDNTVIKLNRGSLSTPKLSRNSCRYLLCKQA